MSYYFTKKVDLSFEEAISTAAAELKNEGFGVLTEINVNETLRKKLNVDFRNYRILGACNPQYAFEALQAEDKIGLMLPCNVIVQEAPDGQVEVSAIDPIASMQAVSNSKIGTIAAQIQAKLKKVIEAI